MSAVDLGVQRFSGGRVVERTVAVVKRNFGSFSLLALILMGLPGLLFQLGNLINAQSPGFVSTTGFSLLGVGGLIGLFTTLLAYAAIIRGAVADLNGRKLSIGELLSGGAQSILPLLGVSICAVIALMFAFMLFLIPGLILLTIWAVIIPVQVIERPSGLGAFGRSGALTRGHRWKVFGLGFLYVVVFSVLGVALGGVLAALGMGGLSLALPGGGGIGSINYVVGAVSAAVNAVLTMIGTVFGSVLYFELRAAKEGLAPRDLASVFE
jgi:hypothetical protein